MKNGLVFAIDPGNTTGYAVIDADREEVEWYGVIRRDATYRREIKDLLEEAKWLVIETQYLGKNPQSMKKLIEIRAAIEEMFIETGGDWGRIIEIAPQTWQSAYGLKGKRQERKRGAMVAATRELVKYGKTGKYLTQDSADAICLGLAAIRRQKWLDMQKAIHSTPRIP